MTTAIEKPRTHCAPPEYDITRAVLTERANPGAREVVWWDGWDSVGLFVSLADGTGGVDVDRIPADRLVCLDRVSGALRYAPDDVLELLGVIAQEREPRTWRGPQ